MTEETLKNHGFEKEILCDPVAERRTGVRSYVYSLEFKDLGRRIESPPMPNNYRKTTLSVSDLEGNILNRIDTGENLVEIVKLLSRADYKIAKARHQAQLWLDNAKSF